MQVAEILSDLTSLNVCDPNAALALVSARPNGVNGGSTSGLNGDKESDPDLNQAKDLITLHATIKVAHQDGTDKELDEAREAVQKVLRTL